MALSQTLVIARSACLKGLYSCILFHFRLYFREILTRHILPQAVSLPADPLYRAKELMSPYITCWQMEQRWHRAAFLSSLHILQNDQCSGYSVHTCLGLSWGTSQLLLSQKWDMCCRKLGAVVHKPASFGFQENCSFYPTAPSEESG